MARSVNMAIIVGNLTRDPELRYTPAGHAVCSFGVATNRTWTTADGERKEEAEFHNVVAWNRLAEICSQYLAKGRKVYIQGRLQTRTWEGQDGVRRSRTEIIADDMVILSPRGEAAPTPATAEGPAEAPPPEETASAKSESEAPSEEKEPEAKTEAPEAPSKEKPAGEKDTKKEDVNPKEMPF